MGTKITNATQSWPNVQKAISAFKTEDKTLTKIIKLIPNIIKLLGAISMDISNKVLTFLGFRSYVGGEQVDTTVNTANTGMVEKAKNIWTNHKEKILLSIATIGLLGVGGSLLMSSENPLGLTTGNFEKTDFAKRADAFEKLRTSWIEYWDLYCEKQGKTESNGKRLAHCEYYRSKETWYNAVRKIESQLLGIELTDHEKCMAKISSMGSEYLKHFMECIKE